MSDNADVAVSDEPRHDLVHVLRAGREIVIPPGMSYDDAIEWLARRRDEDSQEVSLSRTFSVFPSEGALALRRVMEERYGWVRGTEIPGGLFRPDQPPQHLDIEISHGVVEQVPWGRFQIPNVEGWVQTGISGKDGLPVFSLGARVTNRYKHEIEQLFDHVDAILKEDSIYRGKPIRLPSPDHETAGVTDYFPKFIDVRSAKLSQMVFSRDIEDLLMDNVFGPVMHTEAFRSAGIPLKMGVLLEGEYGCGKTLVANLLAKVCQDYGWTYVLCEDADDISRCVTVARRFEPAVVFCEDVDRAIAGKRRTKAMDKVLNTIDGIEAKGTEIMVVLTTNHVDDVTPAMRRPGRLDVVVPVGPPDAEAAQRMIALYAGDQIAMDANLSEVGALLSGRTPAVIREVVERAKRSAIVLAGEDGKVDRIDGEALARAARGMRRHLDLLEPKPEPEATPAVVISEAIRYHADKME